MDNPEVLTGLGAALHIDASTQLFRFLFHELSMRAIEPINPVDAHVTLVDAYETRFRINSDKDQDGLYRAQEEASQYLKNMMVGRWVLQSKKKEIGKLEHSKRRVGIYIDDEDGFLKDVRDEIVDIFSTESNGRIRLRNDRAFEPHLTLGTRTKDYHKVGRAFSPEQRKKILIPRSLQVLKEFDISDKTFEIERGEPVEPVCFTLKYRNVPAFVRRAI